MAEKELAILLTAKNMASGPIKKVTGDISTLDRVSGRAGKGIRTLGSNLKNMAVGAGIGVAVAGFAAIKSGLDSLAERENVISATEAAIKATGGAARVSAQEIRTWSEELERATGAAVDDKAIQASANTLLRFTAVTEDNFQRTLAAATDLGAAMKTGPEAGAKLLGIALSDPIKGMAKLRKAGVMLTESEQKRIKQLVKGNKVLEAQNFLLTAVESKTKGAAAASAGPYQRALNLLADAAEDAKMALAEGFLPVLEKVADKLSGALANPKTIDDIRSLGKSIAGGFDAVLNASSQIPWDSIKSAMQMAGTGAKAAFDLFTGLPPWVQTAVLTGWGLNKLTGGAVGGIIGELGKGLIKGVLGVNAGVVNINAGVVNSGGLPLGAATPAAAAAGGLGIGTLTAAGALLAAPIALAITRQLSGEPNVVGGSRGFFPGQRPAPGMIGYRPPPSVRPTGFAPGRQFGGAPRQGPDAGRHAGEAAALQRALAAGNKLTADQITRTYNATAARAEAAAHRDSMAIVAAIRADHPTVNVSVRSVEVAGNRRRRISNTGFVITD